LWFQAQHDAIKAGENFTRYRFAALVAAAEREACAKYVEQCSLPDSYSEACLPDIANELRARGNK
jgi:hypothetical protein